MLEYYENNIYIMLNGGKNMSKVKVIGIDVGYGQTKAFTDENQHCVFPSVYLQTDDEYKKSPAKDSIYINIDGKNYYVGKAAVRKEGLAVFDKQDMFRHKLFILTAIAKLDCNYSGRIALGLPIGDVKELSNKLTSLKGKYVFKFNNVQCNVEITDVSVYPQGETVIHELAAFEEDVENQILGIVDIGQKTVDVAYYNSLELVPRRSRTYDEMGCNYIYQDIAVEASEKLGLELKEYQVQDRIDKRNDINDIADKHFEKFATLIDSELRRLGWNYKTLDRIILVGGGANLVAQYLVKMITDCKVETHQNAVFANACGFFEKAMVGDN